MLKLTLDDINTLSGELNMPRKNVGEYNGFWKNIVNRLNVYPKILRNGILGVNSIKRKSEKDAIINHVQRIENNIFEYNKKEDLEIMTKLNYFCYQNKLYLESAKMHKCISNYYYYHNKINISLEEMQKAVKVLKEHNLEEQLIQYTSDLGYIFYKNHEYVKCEKQYSKVEILLDLYSGNNDRYLSFNHFLRSGMLKCSLGEYEEAKNSFENAMLSVNTNSEKGQLIMQMGVLSKKQKDFKGAAKYYFDAIKQFSASDKNNLCNGYNHMADMYKEIGEIDKALSYIENIMKNRNDTDYYNLYNAFTTYTEIMVMCGTPDKVLQQFKKLLSEIEEQTVFNRFLLDGVNLIIDMGNEDIEILRELEMLVLKNVKSLPPGNDDLKKELRIRGVNISICIKELVVKNEGDL